MWDHEKQIILFGFSSVLKKGSSSSHVDLNQIPSLRAFHNVVNSIIHDYVLILLLVFNRIGQFEFHNEKGFQVISPLYFVERGQCPDVFLQNLCLSWGLILVASSGSLVYQLLLKGWFEGMCLSVRKIFKKLNK